MGVDDQATRGGGELGKGLCMRFVPPSTCNGPPAINFQCLSKVFLC